MKTKVYVTLMFLFLFACATSVAWPVESAKPSGTKSVPQRGKEVYTGTIVAIGGQFGGRSTTFTLTIEGQTSDEEVAQYLEVLKSKGQDGLLDVIKKEKKGSLQVGGRVGRDVNVVRVEKGEEGNRKITMILERWLQFAEIRAGSRTLDYPFTYIELFVDDAKRKGDGTIIPMAKITFEKKNNSIEVENFGAYPARLMGVVKRK